MGHELYDAPAPKITISMAETRDITCGPSGSAREDRGELQMSLARSVGPSRPVDKNVFKKLSESVRALRRPYLKTARWLACPCVAVPAHLKPEANQLKEVTVIARFLEQRYERSRQPLELVRSGQGSSLAVAINRAVRAILQSPQMRRKSPLHMYLTVGIDGQQPVPFWRFFRSTPTI